MSKSVIIIGASLGGLTAAIRLARQGFNVTLLEKNAHVGGKTFEYRAAGFRWDIAPTPFAPKSALQRLFDDLDLDLSDALRLQPIDPGTRYFFPDGASFDLHRDWAALTDAIADLSPDDAVGFLDFLAYAARLHRARKRSSAYRPPAFTLPFARRSMRQAIASRITSDKLASILGSFASAVGGSPFGLAASFNALAHQALSDGRWLPQNGMTELAATLKRLALEQGASIQLNCPVEQIRIEGKLARGVALANGQSLAADAILSSLDIISTLRYLLPAGLLPAPIQRRLNRAKLSSAAFVILLGLRGTFPRLAYHNIFFADDQSREYKDLFQSGIMPSEPTISVTISSKADPLSAPVNQANWLIKIAAPPLSEKFDWAAQRETCRDQVLAILEQRYGFALRDRIRIERHLTPADFQAMTGAWRGALFGRSAHGQPALMASAEIRSSLLNRLYFAGSTTHPGGDNALGIDSGLLAAQAISEDLA